jgi:hypothetical protein
MGDSYLKEGGKSIELNYETKNVVNEMNGNDE